MPKPKNERGVGAVHYVLTSPTYRLVISCDSQAARENDERGTEEEKVFIAVSWCCCLSAVCHSECRLD